MYKRQITNCVKSIPLSQTQGQQLLYKSHDIFEEVINKLDELTIDDLCLSTPGFDLSLIHIFVVITPHATMFSDAIAISNEEKIKGNLIKFRDFETNIELEIDKEFNDELLNLCKSENISAAGIDSNLLRRFNKDYELDHGTMVPMYFINKYYTDYKLVHITYSILNDIELYKFGMAIQKTAKNLNKNTVIIASGDLSHRLTAVSYTHLKEK